MARPALYTDSTRVTIVMSRRAVAQLRKIAKLKGIKFSRLCALLLTRYAEKQTA